MGPEYSRAEGATSLGRLRVQRHGGARERLPRLFVDLVAVMDIDGTPGVAFEAGVEEARGVSSEAPLAKVSFTTLLYVSPVQMIPACDHTGPPFTERRRAGRRAGQRMVGRRAN